MSTETKAPDTAAKVKVGAKEWEGVVGAVEKWADKVIAEGGTLGKMQGNTVKFATGNPIKTALGAVAVGALAATLLRGSPKEQGQGV